MPYSNLRIGRTSIPGQAYLVTTLTAQRKPLFSDYMLGRIVINELRACDSNGAAKTLAFVLMPDHLHWLFELGRSNTLAQVVKRLKGRSAQLIVKHLGQSGPVWQPSFHDHAVRAEESLAETAKYVIMNPLRAGLVTRVEDYALWDAIWPVSESDVRF